MLHHVPPLERDALPGGAQGEKRSLGRWDAGLVPSGQPLRGTPEGET